MSQFSDSDSTALLPVMKSDAVASEMRDMREHSPRAQALTAVRARPPLEISTSVS